MNQDYIDSLLPEALAEYSLQVCERLNGVKALSIEGQEIYQELVYIQKRLRKFRIRVGKVKRGIRVIGPTDLDE